MDIYKHFLCEASLESISEAGLESTQDYVRKMMELGSQLTQLNKANEMQSKIVTKILNYNGEGTPVIEPACRASYSLLEEYLMLAKTAGDLEVQQSIKDGKVRGFYRYDKDEDGVYVPFWPIQFYALVNARYAKSAAGDLNKHVGNHNQALQEYQDADLIEREADDVFDGDELENFMRFSRLLNLSEKSALSLKELIEIRIMIVEVWKTFNSTQGNAASQVERMLTKGQ